MNIITTIGLDIAKNMFQLHGVDEDGNVILLKSLRRGQMLAFFDRLPACLIGMEACATAHYWARTLMAFGHDVRLIPPAYVKPYLRRQKNDAADVAAICEAVTRPSMRFVPVKSTNQQATLMLHSARDLLVSQRTALINALRGHFGEFGVVAPLGARNVRLLIAMINEPGATELNDNARLALLPLATALADIGKQISSLDKAILAAHRRNDVSLRLATIPGIGPITASSLAASIADAGYTCPQRRFAMTSCEREVRQYVGLICHTLFPLSVLSIAMFSQRGPIQATALRSLRVAPDWTPPKCWP